MPKRKQRKPPPASVEERRARGERVVHREEMSTNLGEVLEHEHVDEAIELLYLEDELSGKAPTRATEAPTTIAPAVQDVAVAAPAARVEEGEPAPTVEAWVPEALFPQEAFVPTGRYPEPGQAEEQHAKQEQAKQEQAQQEQAQQEHAKQEAPAAAKSTKRERRRHLLSPVFLVKAAWHAAIDVVEGVQRATADVREALRKARGEFV